MALMFSVVCCHMSLVYRLDPCWQIENCLHEWQTGSFKPVDFTEKAYKAIYDVHLVTLTKWRAHPQGSAILAQLQQRLHDNARYVIVACHATTLILYLQCSLWCQSP